MSSILYCRSEFSFIVSCWSTWRDREDARGNFAAFTLSGSMMYSSTRSHRPGSEGCCTSFPFPPFFWEWS